MGSLWNLFLFDGFAILLYVVVTCMYVNKISEFGYDFRRLFIYLAVIQFATTLYYIYGSILGGADAIMYYRVGKSMTFFTFKQGTFFVIDISRILTNAFGLSYIGSMYFCSLVGLLGWYYLLVVLIHISHGLWTQWYYILLMPQLHYWTCALGKDSLIFWGICMIVYYWYFSKTYWYYLLPCFVVGYIRSPILMVFATVYILLYLLKSKTNIFVKILISCTLLGGIIAFMPMVEERLGGLDIISSDSFSQFVEIAEIRNQGHGSSVDLRGANIVVKMFSYIFRPFFFDVRNVFQLEASFENLIWLFLFYSIVRNWKLKYLAWFPTLTFLLLWIAQGSSVNNLGIAMRQKMMFFPMFFILFIQMIYDASLSDECD